MDSAWDGVLGSVLGSEWGLDVVCIGVGLVKGVYRDQKLSVS